MISILVISLHKIVYNMSRHQDSDKSRPGSGEDKEVTKKIVIQEEMRQFVKRLQSLKPNHPETG